MANQPRYPGDDPSTPIDPAYTGPVYEYDTTSACTTDPPAGPRADTNCTRATAACAAPGHGPGPLTRIWRRLTQNGTPLPGSTWENIGITCYSDAITTPRPRITMAMILTAFHTTAWATPQITTQPVGNRTLVGLDTYYQVTWEHRRLPTRRDRHHHPPRLHRRHPPPPRPLHLRLRRRRHLRPHHGTRRHLPRRHHHPPLPHPRHLPPPRRHHLRRRLPHQRRPLGPHPDTITIPGPPTTLDVTTATNHLVTH